MSSDNLDSVGGDAPYTQNPTGTSDVEAPSDAGLKIPFLHRGRNRVDMLLILIAASVGFLETSLKILFWLLVGIGLLGWFIVSNRKRIIPGIRAAITRLQSHINRSRLRVIFTVLASGLMILSAIRFRPILPSTDLDLAVILMLLGGISLGIARFIKGSDEVVFPVTTQALTPACANLRVTFSGIFLLAILTDISAPFLRIGALEGLSHGLQLLVFVASVGLITWGLGGAPGLSKISIPSKSWRNAVPLLLILILALGLRLWQLDTAFRGSLDEAIALTGIFHVRFGDDTFGLFVPPVFWAGRTMLYSELQTLAIGLIGQNLVGLRAADAVAGALNVVALYLVVSTLLDRKTALFAALVLATFPAHLHFSRAAIVNTFDTLWGLLAFAFIARGIKHNQRLDWALAGLALGLTQYFFEAGRLFFPPLIVLWLVVMSVVFGIRSLRPHRGGIIVMFICAILIAAPVYFTLATLKLPVAVRLNTSGADIGIFQNEIAGVDIQRLLAQFTVPMLVFVHLPDLSPFYQGTQALVLDYLVPVFLLGVFFWVWNWRSPMALLTLLWLLATVIGNGLLRDMAAYSRYVVVFPAIAITIAATVRYIVPWILSIKFRSGVLITQIVLIALIGFGQIDYYFGRHLYEFNAGTYARTLGPDGFDAVLRSIHLPANSSVYLVNNPLNDASTLKAFLVYFLDDPSAITLDTLLPEQVTEEFLAALPADRNLAFFIPESDKAILSRLQSHFTLTGPHYSPYLDAPYPIPKDEAFVIYFAAANP